jgi:hypothetical protein
MERGNNMTILGVPNEEFSIKLISSRNKQGIIMRKG